jgi:hypothetical protein
MKDELRSKIFYAVDREQNHTPDLIRETAYSIVGLEVSTHYTDIPKPEEDILADFQQSQLDRFIDILIDEFCIY